jgi:tetratricopeptide (TPR) repeat protein
VGLGNELDLIRVLWLEGRVLTGLERREEALRALEQVRRYFTANRIAYDAALASLEVAIFYLEQEQTSEVKRLAEEMLWIFKDQGVHQEALAALRLFYEAVKKEEATPELARRVADYLVKARYHPELRFTAWHSYRPRKPGVQHAASLSQECDVTCRSGRSGPPRSRSSPWPTRCPLRSCRSDLPRSRSW